MTLKIYGMLRSRATRNIWLARELKIPYELVPVMQARRLTDPSAADAVMNTTSKSYHAINPSGLIPSIDDDGFILSESLAINLYLARKHGGPLAPTDLREDGLMTMWALRAIGEYEPAAIDILLNRVSRPENQRDPTAAAAAVAALERPFGVLEKTLLAGRGHVVGGRFTVTDINLAEVLRYTQMATELFAKFPAVKAWLAACQARPAFVEMMVEREAEPE